ncbi:MAG TPA: nuclear transport factor 2 family protein [Vicinamibacterales bacterium]|nr:nuclear transport factor 2 family protein [Vicinamibacterales bacterium]
MKSSTLVLLLALPIVADQPVRAQTPAALTARDRIEINQLAARYAFALDSRADDGRALADLFAPDGELVGLGGSAKGRDQLAELARSGVITPKKPDVGVAHFGMNHAIEPAAAGAVGKEYLIMVNIAEGGLPGGDFSSIGGHYEDVYVKTADVWRFKRRAFIPMKSVALLPRSAAVAAPTRATTAPAPPSRGGRELTADDYLAIRALANTYAYGLDTGADDGGLYASVFTEDAEFHGPPAVPGGKPFDAKGRDALRQFARVDRGSAYVRHFMTNHLIEPSPEGARGKVYLLVIDIAQGGKPTTVNMGGHYDDVYVKTAAGWRIKIRHFYRSKSAQTLKAEADAAAGSGSSVPKE